MDMFEKVKSIFYSGSHDFRGDFDSINEICFLITNGYLNLNVLDISSKKSYLELLSQSQKIDSRSEADGGGRAHIALKILAAEFINKYRGKSFVFEHIFCGYYPDVLSDDKSVAIECGHTQNPEKILSYFLDGNVDECIQIPYPKDDDGSIMGYVFTSDNKSQLKNFLKELQCQKLSEVKSIFKNRHI
jgi:hypothetical protein